MPIDPRKLGRIAKRASKAASKKSSRPITQKGFVKSKRVPRLLRMNSKY